MALTLAQLAPLKSKDPQLYEALSKMVSEINLTQKATGVAAQGRLSAPPAIGGISVTSANGAFDIAITDQVGSLQPGIVYFVEFDTSPNFANAHTKFLGPARNEHIWLGNAVYYWRAYSTYLGSTVRSPIVTFGDPPTGLSGGGGAVGPAPQATQGSGTSKTPGYGFGSTPNLLSGAKTPLK